MGNRVALIPRAAVAGERGSSSVTSFHSYSDKAAVTGAIWVEDDTEPLFIITTYHGVQVFGPDGITMRFWAPLAEHSVSPSVSPHMIGAALILSSSGRRLLCIGTSHSTIVAADPRSGVVGTIDHSTAPITALAGSGLTMASADSQGTILLWALDDVDLPKERHSFHPHPQPVTSMVLRGRLLAASYSTGLIHLFETVGCISLASIAAHARPIYALSLHPRLPLVASVGQDSHLRVWKVPSEDELEKQADWSITSTFQAEIPNATLTGVAFTGPVGDSIGVVAYESDALTVWTGDKK